MKASNADDSDTGTTHVPGDVHSSLPKTPSIRPDSSSTSSSPTAKIPVSSAIPEEAKAKTIEDSKEKMGKKVKSDYVDSWSKEFEYNLYPERKEGEKAKIPLWRSALLGDNRGALDKIRCEKNVYACVRDSPIIKLMLSALKSSGCEVDIRRHISCESCNGKVMGGYDQELNQVVICQNVARRKDKVQNTLTHEFIHMFDFCQNKLDYHNLDHLVCTEVRAANMTHCSFLGAFFQGEATPFNVKKRHRECVKSAAIYSVRAVRQISEEEVRASLDRVFDKCYADLEPIGRRIRRKSEDIFRVYREKHLYGYNLD